MQMRCYIAILTALAGMLLTALPTTKAHASAPQTVAELQAAPRTGITVTAPPHVPTSEVFLFVRGAPDDLLPEEECSAAHAATFCLRDADVARPVPAPAYSGVSSFPSLLFQRYCVYRL